MADKDSSDIWREIAEGNENASKVMRTSFVNDITSQKEGVSGDKEKFIKGLHTFSPKRLPANKHDND